MSREIKFRAWLKNEKRMVKVQDLIFNGTGVVGFQESNKDQNTDGKFHILRDCLKINEDLITDIKFNRLQGGYNFIMFEIMQYTCLKDKNGVEIYEGDIVRCDDEICSIVWDEPYVTYAVSSKENGNDSLGNFEPKDLEVIGNVWEHKHLLGEQNDS